MSYGWVKRKKGSSIPLQEFYSLSLGKNELAAIYLGYAGILLRSQNHTIAFDLGKESLHNEEIQALKSLDVHFYSHTHWDHWELKVSKKILEQTGAPIVAEPQIAQELMSKVESNLLNAAIPEDTLTINDFGISAITGVHGRPITLFRVKWDGFSVFHGADSGYIPLTKYPADVAFLPTGTPSPTCSPENALKAALELKPKVAIAMHGIQSQLQKFSKLMEKEMPDTAVMLPKAGELLQISL
ncbi:MAG: MBL fold metallo-hydrolase [Candidatus Hodarchaeales archaeon]|jgi:L-ascorbate metabolism protein UlaG (beta-lactamase superfamily)